MGEESTPTPPEAGGGGQAPEAGASGAPETPPDRTFNQADVDRIVKERLERQRGQFKDYDDLKAKASRLDELEGQQRTEGEKLLAARDKALKEAKDATEREQAATTRANETLIRAAVVSEAAKQQAVDPQDVYGLLDKSKVTISDDGEVTGAAEAVKQLLSDKPHLVGTRPGGGGFDGGARGAPSGGPTMNDLIRREAGFSPQR